MKITKTDKTYTIERDDGTVVVLSLNEVNLLVNNFNLDTLRDSIEYVVDQMIEDGEIDIDAYEDGKDAFIDEIYECFSDDVEQGCGNPDDDKIKETIYDEAKYYDGMLVDDDDEEEE